MKNNNRLVNAAYLAADALTFPLMRRTPHILVASMPKSASTFMTAAFASLKGFKRYRLTPVWVNREQELCPIRLSRYNRRKYVANHHLKCSEWTMGLLAQYRITPVVLVRDLADCTMSLRDHFYKEAPPHPFNQGHLDRGGDALEEALVRITIPWYFGFYVSWREAGVPIYDYKQCTTDPAGVIAEVLDRAKYKASPSEIQAALNHLDQGGQTRLNVGKSGRGSELGDHAKAQLLQMLDLFPEYDEDPLFIQTRKTLTQPAGATTA